MSTTNILDIIKDKFNFENHAFGFRRSLEKCICTRVFNMSILDTQLDQSQFVTYFTGHPSKITYFLYEFNY